MKKREFAIIFVLVSILIISISLASALEKTKIYGAVDPNENVKLLLSYTANSVNIQDQLITRGADDLGNWEYKISSDSGTIEFEISYKGQKEEFTIPVGQDFQISWNGETFKEGAEEELTAGVEETNTTEDASTEETTSGSSGITGKSIFGDTGEIKMPGNWKTYLIIIFVFIAMIIANILSTLILGFFQRPREHRKLGPSKEEIKIVKLSERLAQIKNNEEEVQRELEEARRNK